MKTKERRDMLNTIKIEKNIPTQQAEVVVMLDYSGSMDSLYRNGTVQDVVERLLPIGLSFDDNQAVDMYIFSNDYHRLSKTVTMKNVNGYVQNFILNKNYRMGGTDYAPALNDIYNRYVKTSGGFLGFGKKETQKLKNPVYIIFITDGENNDESETDAIVRKLSEHGVFIQFVGIGGASFRYLKRLDNLNGRLLDNANFFEIKNISNETDANLYAKLMAEFPSWTHQARAKGLID